MINDFDFENIYSSYPRKIGKQKGLEKCKRDIKTQFDFDNLNQAVKNYTLFVTGQDAKFVKHFSSFMGCWKDFIKIEKEQVSDKIDRAKIFRVLSSGSQRVADAKKTFDLTQLEENFLINSGGLLQLSRMSEFEVNRLLNNTS